MAYRDVETEPREFLGWILELKRTQMRAIGAGPMTTVVAGCAGYVMPGDWRPQGRRIELEARLAAWFETCGDGTSAPAG